MKKMFEIKTAYRLFLIACCLFLLPKISQAASYYISPSGNNGNTGDSCSSGHPWKTFAYAKTRLSAGDILYLCDGTYTAATTGMLIIDSTWPNGTSGSYITIKSLNTNCYGGHSPCAVIDGENSQPGVVRVIGRSYYNLEDIIAMNEGTGDAVVDIYGGATYINIRRVSAYNAGPDNSVIFQVYGISTQHILIEDCIASQKSVTLSPGGDTGRYLYIMNGGTSYVTLRRNYGKYVDHLGMGGPCAGLIFYTGSNSIVENNVFNFTGAKCSNNPNHGCIYGQAAYHPSNDNDKFYGNVCYADSTLSGWQGAFPDIFDKTGNGWEFYHNVWINFSDGIWQEDSDDFKFYNNTVMGQTRTDAAAYWKRDNSDHTSYCSGGLCNGDIKNSSFISAYRGIKNTAGTLTHSYNNFYDISDACFAYTSQGTGEYCNVLNPNYNTTTYGKGAYLIVPPALKGKGENGADIGADVRYRYVNSVLTSTPLWPWPMEERIKAETGYSVTYESGGGIWKTLSGVYSQPDIPPAAPTGLVVR